MDIMKRWKTEKNGNCNCCWDITQGNDFKQICKKIDKAFEGDKSYEELEIALLQVWVEEGLISGGLSCGIGGSED